MLMKIGTGERMQSIVPTMLQRAYVLFILPLPLAHHARHAVLRVKRLLIKRNA